MKCPGCGRNHKKSEGMKCHCGYGFTFHPQRDGFADGKFVAWVNSASQNGTLFYTPYQLYATYCRKVIGGQGVAFGCGLFALIVVAVGCLLQFGILTFGAPPGYVIIIVGSIGSWVAYGIYVMGRPKNLETFNGYVDRWRQDGKLLDKLITEPSLNSPPPDWEEEDIYDHGFARLLIVNRRILVDWFVLNGLHMEEHAAVITGDGYPSYILDRIRPHMEQHKEIPVFLAHDALRGGFPLSPEVERIVEGHQKLDLGLSQEDVPNIGRLRPTKRSGIQHTTPLDFLPYTMLSGGIGMAMAEYLSLADLIQRNAGGSDSGGGDGGSFG